MKDQVVVAAAAAQGSHLAPDLSYPSLNQDETLDEDTTRDSFQEHTAELFQESGLVCGGAI